MQRPVFESGQELIDVTSMSRPDTGWSVVDMQGHKHQWHRDGKPATSYDPSGKYSTPTLVWIKDGVGYYEDGDTYDIGHHQCRECGQHIEPGFTSDSFNQYIGGLRWYRIDGQDVSREEFERRLSQFK